MDIALQREKTAAEHGHSVSAPCEKCMGPDMPWMMEPPPPPLGGATSFTDLKAYREAQQEEGLYYTATFDFQDLQSNIMRDETKTVQEKADALIKLTAEFKKVVNNVDAYYPNFKEYDEDDEDKAGKRMSTQQVNKFYGALDTLKKLFKWAKYEEDEENQTSEVDFAKASGFKIYNTKEGPRWLTYSSNAFKDLEGELFTTAALEEAVEWADKNDNRGPLRIFHVSGADIGDADYQAIVGRFLVESGTFRNDDLGQKAVKYFEEHDDEDFQVSIGFTFKSGDEKDGVYDWLRIRERSITPHGDAANPFTSFAFGGLGGKELEERKRKMLDDIFGADLASRIVGQAETKSKELEEQGVSYKSTDLLGEITALARDLPEDKQGPFAALVEKYAKAAKMPPGKDPKMMADQAEEGQENPDGSPKKPAKKELDSEAVVTAIEALTGRLDEFKSLQTAVSSLEAQVKTLLEEKEEDKEAPRGKGTFRASESADNLLDKARIKELLGDTEDKAPVNPAQKYVESLVGQIG